MPGLRIPTTKARLHNLGMSLFLKQALQKDVSQTIINLSMLMRNSLCMPSGLGAFPGLINLHAFITSSHVKGFAGACYHLVG